MEAFTAMHNELDELFFEGLENNTIREKDIARLKKHENIDYWGGEYKTSLPDTTRGLITMLLEELQIIPLDKIRQKVYVDYYLRRLNLLHKLKILMIKYKILDEKSFYNPG